MNYLLEKPGSKSSLRASRNIMILYYQKFQTNILTSLVEKFGHDLDLPLVNFVYNQIKSNLRVTEEGGNFVKLKGLNMMPFEDFPACLKPNVLKEKWGVIFEKEEKYFC
jgi:hypothetical protein